MTSDSQRLSGLTPQNSSGNDDLGLLDYYKALYQPSKAQIVLASGQEIALTRVGLGAQYYMEHLAQGIRVGPLDDRASLFCRWLEAAGVSASDDLTLDDVVKLAAVVKALNLPQGFLAWDFFPTPEIERDRPVDYTGRELARIVHLLASHYHWSLEEILALPKEVAQAHAQECVLADQRQREWDHYLSEIGWEYDKNAKVNRYRELPPLPWEGKGNGRPGGSDEDVPEHVKAKYWPDGVIVDLQDEYRKRKANGNGTAAT